MLSRRPSSASIASSLPRFSSMLAIMPKKLATLRGRWRIGRAVPVGHEERAVRGIGREVGEERLAPRLARPDPIHRLGEEDVGAIALEPAAGAVVLVDVVEVIVVPDVGRRGDVRGREEERLLEAALLGPVGITVAEMPLAELARAVAAGREDLGHGREAAAEHRPAAADVHGAVGQGIPAAHELAARRRAHGRHVEIGQAEALAVQPVEVRRLEHGIAVAGEVAVALVVGQHDDHIRFRGRQSRGGVHEEQGSQEEARRTAGEIRRGRVEYRSLHRVSSTGLSPSRVARESGHAAGDRAIFRGSSRFTTKKPS